MNKTTIALRILVGAGVVVTAMAAGVMQRSPWIILPLGLSFTILYILGKLRQWMKGVRQTGWAGALKALPMTIGVQILLAGLLYFVGFGFASLASQYVEVRPFSSFDWIYSAAALAGFGALAGLIAWLERDLPDPIEQALAQIGGDDKDFHWPFLLEGLDVHPAPVTLDNLFDDLASSHKILPPDQARAASQGEEVKIHAAEQRLGLRLPEGLRAVYRCQNGGAIADVWAGAVETPFSDPSMVERWIGVFPDFRDLRPTEELETLADNLSLFEDSDDDVDLVVDSEEARKLVILSQWERKSLFLDYRLSGPPRVGCADFDDEDWAAHAFYWRDFETFFAVLRREDYEDEA